MGTSAKELKHQANAAFKAGQWQKAIDLYTHVIQEEGDNHLIYSNRSAAYVKSGQFELALADANKCIALEPGFTKGYGRKGVALHAMNRFDHAVAAYKEGLKLSPNDPHLDKGLAAAKRARVSHSSAAKAARNAQNAVKAQRSRSIKAQRAPTVSSFLQQAKRDLQMQMAAIQAKLDVINEMATLSSEGKADLIFAFIDQDGNGTIDANELAVALQKGTSQNDFRDAVARAAGTIAAFDRNGDSMLDTEEFGDFLTITSKELGVEYDEFAEYLTIQLLTSENIFVGHQENVAPVEQNPRSFSRNGDQAISSRREASENSLETTGELVRHLNDTNLVELFKMFDKDETLTEVSFRDVAIDLFRLSRDLNKARRRTVEAMLMMNETDSRKLSYEQFARLVLAYVVVSETTFDELADDLRFAMTIKDTLSDADMRCLLMNEELYQAAKILQEKNPNMSIDPLTFARLTKLFDLWDDNHNGAINFNELTVHLQKFQATVGAKGDATLIAMSLIGFDTDGDQQLDRYEFAVAMMNYANNLGVAAHDLVDFCSLSTVLSKDDAKAYLFI